MKTPDRTVRTADETHAEFHRAKRSHLLMRLEAKLLIGLTVIVCLALFLLYRAVFVLPPPPPPVPASTQGDTRLR